VFYIRGRRAKYSHWMWHFGHSVLSKLCNSSANWNISHLEHWSVVSLISGQLILAARPIAGMAVAHDEKCGCGTVDKNVLFRRAFTPAIGGLHCAQTPTIWS
jgi:hypothetical protein